MKNLFTTLVSRLLIPVLACLAIVSCQKNQPEEVKAEIQIPQESLDVFRTGISFDGTDGQSAQVKFIATAEWTATASDTKASSWLTVNPASGGAGEITITVSAGANPSNEERTAEVAIRCGLVGYVLSVRQAGSPQAEIPVSGITLNTDALTLQVDQWAILKATIAPENATNQTVTWSTSNDKVATVDANGRVTAVAEGEAVITAKAGDKSATCAVTVKPKEPEYVGVTNVTLDKSVLRMEEGTTEQLTATVIPEDATDKTLQWASSDDTVATVDQNGKVTAVAEGEATISVSAGEHVATCKVTVYYVFNVNPTECSFPEEGDEFTVQVACSGEYSVASMPEWVTQVSVSNKLHTFQVAANTANEIRTGAIVFQDAKGTRLSCSLWQAAHIPDEEPTDEGGNEDITDGGEYNW